jgi:hypothetical protein
MSNFPYNNDRYKYIGNPPDGNPPNGTPLTFQEMRAIADTILYWHTENDTSDFSQSGDGFWDGVNYLTLGLLELLSDPNAVHRLMTTGREVKRQVDLAEEVSGLNVTKTGVSDLVAKVLKTVFEEEE